MTGFFSRWFGGGKQESGAAKQRIAVLASTLAVPAVHVVKSAAPSRSHFGGSPNLPAGIVWPERNGARLTFLARMSLSEVHAAFAIEWLPADGALLFFYDVDEQPWGFDPKDRGGWRVLHVRDLAAPALPPANDPDSAAPALRFHFMAFRPIDVLPSFDREPVMALQLNDAESDAYDALANEVFMEAPKHQVGGLPAAVQGDGMELESQLASNGLYCGDESGYSDPRAESLAAGAGNWRLLFQIDSDDDLDVMWGDAGTIYFWVEAEAAREHRFENAWLVLQCS
jgi:uncharacterized protein YwqG